MEKGFIEIHTPVLTQLPLYEEKTAFRLDFFGHKVFLTQCSAFYLESAVHAFERVYNIGPSFRAEESKSKRHLAEYWHLKAELAFADLEDTISFTEDLISSIIKEVIGVCETELHLLGVSIDRKMFTSVPFPRITYKEVHKELSGRNRFLKDGQSLGADEIKTISRRFKTPFWIVGLPRNIEPFPYVVDPSDPAITRTADLIVPGHAGGELLGVAEKIHTTEDFRIRMKEKNKNLKDGYKWYYELRQMGSIPHSGMGMGIERCIRWLLGLNHVRDAIPFPRLFKRVPYP